jgi:hypothetical protein
VDIRPRGGTNGHPEPIPYNGKDELLPYLAMGPEIAPYALRLFYEQNTFRLTASIGIWNDNTLSARLTLPCMHHRPYIRRITVHLPLNLRSISIIESIANGAHGFPQLQHVGIVFIWEPGSTNRPDSITSHQFHALIKRKAWSARFSCGGVVRVRSYKKRWLDDPITLADGEIITSCVLTNSLRGFILFA